MRTISCAQITDTVKNLTEACLQMMPSCREALERALLNETSKNAAFAIKTLLQNGDISAENRLPLCQDTGMAVLFVKLGQDVHITGGSFYDALNNGIRIGYAERSLRASVLDPLTRINTGDNTPAVIHTEIVDGENIEISFLPKGFGSENMSKLFMLTPSAGIDGIIDCVIKTVKLAGSNPCPPIIVGVGIGGTAEKAMELAKIQILRDVGTPAADKTLAGLETELLDKINSLEIGAQGFGGVNTALAVHVGKYPTHISALPVAVNIQCNAARVSKAVM